MDINKLADEVMNQGRVKLKNEWEGYDDLSFIEGVIAVFKAAAKIKGNSKNDKVFTNNFDLLCKILAERAVEETDKLVNYYNQEFKQ
jgi:hypothetical protein